MRLENSMSERSEFAIFSIFSQSEICFLENLNSCERFILSLFTTSFSLL